MNRLMPLALALLGTAIRNIPLIPVAMMPAGLPVALFVALLRIVSRATSPLSTSSMGAEQ